MPYRIQAVTAATLTSLLLSACVGSGADEASDDARAASAPTPRLTIQGVVASGAAWSGATVTARCSKGATSGQATTDSNGRYTVIVPRGVLPCSLSATLDSRTTDNYMLSAAISTTANITPLTYLLLVQMNAQIPNSYSLSAPDPETVTATNLAAARPAIIALLADAGITGAPSDFIETPLVAATANAAGNAYDQMLDALQAKLTEGGSTVSDLAVAVQNAATNRSFPDVGVNNASLPANLLLRKGAPTCDKLRTGDYRFISLTPGSVGTPNTQLLTMEWDGTHMTMGAKGSNVEIELTPDADTTNNKCVFTTANNHQLVVAASGVIAMLAPTSGGRAAAIAFPEQAPDLADLVGTWNFMGSELDTSSSGTLLKMSKRQKVVRDREGHLKEHAACASDAAATELCVSNKELITTRTDGGFDFTTGRDTQQPKTTRLFSYRAGNGAVMTVSINDAGEVQFGRRALALGASAKGYKFRNWEMVFASGSAQAPAFDGRLRVYDQEVTSVTEGADDKANTWILVRNATPITDDADAVDLTKPRTETLTYYNTESNIGYSARDATAPSPDKAAVPASVDMPIQEMGLTFSSVTSLAGSTFGSNFSLLVPKAKAAN